MVLASWQLLATPWSAVRIARGRRILAAGDATVACTSPAASDPPPQRTGHKSSLATFGVFRLVSCAVYMGCAPGAHRSRWFPPVPDAGSSPVVKWFAAAAVVAVGFPLALMLLVFAAPSASQASTSLVGGPRVLAPNDTPPSYLAVYMAAAQTCPGLPWAVLAGIGEVETDHGQSKALGVQSGANYAGAEGPMQFEPATFAQYAVNADPGAPLSPYDPADAIYTAAAMLCANGAASGTEAGIRQSIFAYNHSQAYVTDVLSWAARYTVPAPLALAAAAIAFAVRQLGKPYQWGATGPAAYDCSGL